MGYYTEFRIYPLKDEHLEALKEIRPEYARTFEGWEK